MAIKNPNLLFKEAAKVAGWDLGLIEGQSFRADKSITATRRQLSIEIFEKDDHIKPDAIYFSGDHPIIHFKCLAVYNQTDIYELHKKIWNEGRSPFLTIITHCEIRVYDAYDRPVNDANNIEDRLLHKFADAREDLENLAAVLGQSQIDSGKVWENELGKKINSSNKVDRTLIKNLRAARKKLVEAAPSNVPLPLDVAHDLLGRTLFTFYLEHRDILKPEEISEWPKGIENFMQLLEKRDATYRLFGRLKKQFNGDLFPVSDEESLGVNQDHLNIVKACFFGDDLVTGQRSFFQLFNFKYIPIELISAIYEEFMSSVDNGQIADDNGAFYTKPMLAEFMLNEALPWPDEREENQRYDLRIIDPACGSGIFLSESLRRLIARWQYKHSGKLTAKRLQKLLNNIYGIEKDEQAIKVAAFSLYLTFLSYLEPEEIRSDYINGEEKLAPLIYWSNPQKIKRAKNGMGSNLFQVNAFDFDCELLKQRFDLVVGNPPWKRNKGDDKIDEYNSGGSWPTERAAAFMRLGSTLMDDNGQVCFVVNAKLLFNSAGTSQYFRNWLFTQNTVLSITNLCLLRDFLFNKAEAPAAVIVYKKRDESSPLEETENILYCVPKSVKDIDTQHFILIDSSEIKFIPTVDAIKNDSKIFKITMWGGMRDYRFIKRLKSLALTIDESISEDQRGGGLHSKGKGKGGNAQISDHLFIETPYISQYYTNGTNLKKLGDDHNEYAHKKASIFKPPLVLIKEGSTDSEICSSYIDYDCAYKSSVYGIAIKTKTAAYHKALAALLNSQLATYFYFLVSSRWSVDKRYSILNEEAISLPMLTEKMDTQKINELADKVDSITKLIRNDLQSNRKDAIEEIRNDINKLIYDAAGITIEEQKLIKHSLDYSIGLKSRYNASGAELPVSKDKQLKSYAKTLAQVLNKTLKHGGQQGWVEYFNSDNNPLSAIVIHFNDENSPGKVSPSNTDIGVPIKKINQFVYEQYTESIYFRKVFKYFKGDSVYIIKPNERRFWSEAQALNDGDDLLAELIGSK